MSIKLYSYWRSSASYRVRLALNLKKISYQYIPVHLVKDGGEQHQQAYLGLNPAELVPTLVDEDEDIILNQSLAIIEYLDEKYSSPVRLLPEHKLQRARVRALALDIAADIQPLANLRVLQHLESAYQVDTQGKTDWSRHWIEKGFAAIERRLQNTAGKFCFGFDLTMADVCLIPQVYNAQRFGVDMSQFPLIQRIQENCNKLPEFVSALPENQPDAQ
ncbi:maleylacetoacetate isomerase [Bowmanella denitrificans]|uniref:maleylacetoacetate isomerase n=1 Tax=Bowmanella denitrificans TaxID=366582 RepID=UPI000C9C6A2F|nr:maleylacetoacetate isomerase [Bowmanella denitrificans]